MDWVAVSNFAHIVIKIEEKRENSCNNFAFLKECPKST